MNQSITINNNKFAIEYHPAKVVHSDKYSERDVFVTNSYFAFTPKHDIVFRENQTGHEFFFTVEYSKIRTYVGQEVDLITLDTKIIGYLSKAGNDYYYLTNKFAQILNMGIDWKWVLLIEILLGIALFFNKDYTQQGYLVCSLFTIPFVYWIGMRILNFYLEKKVDEVVSKG